MCIFGGGGDQTPERMSTFAPPEARTNITSNPLPRKKDVRPEDGDIELEIGNVGEQTKANPAAGRKKGSSALKIALNQPAAQGSTTGGISNV